MKQFILYIVFSFCYTSFSFAQNNMMYNTFIENLKSNYPLINTANNISKIGNLTLKSARGQYDPFLSSTFDNKFYNGTNYYSILDAKIKQPIFTSQYITAGYQYAQGDYLNPQNTLPANGAAFIGIEASLIQGLILDKRRADVLKSKGYTDYYDAEKNSLTNDILYSASVMYFEWVFACKELSLYDFFSKQAYIRFTAIKALTEVGEYAAMDSIEAQILFQSRNLELQSIQMETTKKSAEIIKLSWGENGETAVFHSNIILTDSLELCFEKSKLKYLTYIQDTTLNNPVLDKYTAYQKILAIDNRYKAELIKPKLDISYNFISNNITGFENSFNTNNYKWGLNFSVPIFLRNSRNELKISKINLTNNRLELSNKKVELTVNIDALRSIVEITLDQLSYSEKNVHYSSLLLNAEKEKFNVGESSVFLVNTRETKLMEAKLKLAEYQLKFIKTIFEMEYIKGNMDYAL